MTKKFCSACSYECISSLQFCPRCGRRDFTSSDVQVLQQPATQLSETFQQKPANSVSSKWLLYAIYANIFFDIVGMISGGMQYHLLSTMTAAMQENAQETIKLAETNDTRQAVIGTTQVIVTLSTMLLFLIWTYKSNRYARQVAKTSLQYTPGWSVGWNFVPFANLWKPYDAMKEIWLVTANAAGRIGATIPSYFQFWWIAWIICNIVGNVSFRLSLRAKEINELLLSTQLQIAADISSVVAMLFAIKLITDISSMQVDAETANN